MAFRPTPSGDTAIGTHTHTATHRATHPDTHKWTYTMNTHKQKHASPPTEAGARAHTHTHTQYTPQMMGAATNAHVPRTRLKQNVLNQSQDR
mmetsp:Transcript_1081/g.1799  ORF Transcript_1081/g.1799 Transcript_1081/m.1799 type:complete len:92 (+) Transcript_1081:178-453(+)